MYDILSVLISCRYCPELPQTGKEFKASLMGSVAMVLQDSLSPFLCQPQSLQSRTIEVKKTYALIFKTYLKLQSLIIFIYLNKS